MVGTMSLVATALAAMATTALAQFPSLVAPSFPATPSIPPALDPSINGNPLTYYLGYRGTDGNTPWGKYYNNTPVALQPQFADGLAKSPWPAASGLAFKDAPAALSKPGYLPIENGYTFLSDGTLVLSVQTMIPSEFTGEQYDWWFSWHINETTKYKLWYPEKHQFADVQRSEIAGNAAKSSYRERYWNVTSLVDEYITQPMQLSISFFDPRIAGFPLEVPSTGVETIVTAYIQVMFYVEVDAAAKATQGLQPFDVVLAHQVRARPDGQGKEIRSRFWFGPSLVAAMRLVMDPEQLARDLSKHCNSEMSHLSTFLPRIFAEFKDDVAVVTS